MRRTVICGIIILFSVLYFYTSRALNTNERDRDVSLKLLLAAAIKAAEIGGSEVIAVHDQVKFEIESKGKTKEGNKLVSYWNMLAVFCNYKF